MSTRALPGRLQSAIAAHGRWQAGSIIARTTVFNAAAAATAALAGVIIARAAGPAVRGEYAAVTSWFGLLLIVGDMGQTAAVCFYVAREPHRARGYLATSRIMMMATGAVSVAIGMTLAPVLAHGDSGVAAAYRVIFAGSVVEYVGVSYIGALQARSIRRWNLARLSQPALYLTGIVLLWLLRRLTLENMMLTLVATIAIQLCWAGYLCRKSELAAGRFQRALVGPLAKYGLTQFSAVAPATVNAYLDQLVLSQTVPTAGLGCYAIATSLSLVPVLLVSAIGNVAFPRLAAQQVVTARSRRLSRVAILASAGIASAFLLPVAGIAYWAIPFVFGPGFRAAVPLLWLLTPGGIFLACGQVAGDLLRGLGRPGLVAGAQGLAAVFTVVLLFALLPFVGVAAAAIASSVAYGVALAAMVRCLWGAPFSAGNGPRQELPCLQE